LAVGFGLIHRSDVFASIDNTVVLPAYTTANAAVFFHINESWRLQANFQNAFNTNYFLNADGNNNITPGAPRSARVSLIARF
jgi:catecholate siderophore receptor